MFRRARVQAFLVLFVLCLPGLIDLHAHISLTPTPTLGLDLTRASADRALDALYAAQKMLDAGFTTLRPESVAKAKALQADRDERMRHAFEQGIPIALPEGIGPKN